MILLQKHSPFSLYTATKSQHEQNLFCEYGGAVGVPRILFNYFIMEEKEKEVIKIFYDILQEQKRQTELINNQNEILYFLKNAAFWFFLFYIFIPILILILKIVT